MVITVVLSKMFNRYGVDVEYISRLNVDLFSCGKWNLSRLLQRYIKVLPRILGWNKQIACKIQEYTSQKFYKENYFGIRGIASVEPSYNAKPCPCNQVCMDRPPSTHIQ